MNKTGLDLAAEILIGSLLIFRYKGVENYFGFKL